MSKQSSIDTGISANKNRVTNFSTDVKDGENYTVLLNQLAPDVCSRGPLQTRDLLERAEQVLQNADSLDCRKFLTPTSLVAGNPKLNLAFVANLFNTHPGLDPITEEEKLEVEDFDAEGEREARVFTLWLNSLDVQPAVNSLFDDLRDGNVLLQAYDKVIPGSVNWKHVNKPPASGAELMRFKAVENTNYSIELGKFNGFSLVGVQGADITDGQRTLTLGLVWQLMRRDITNTLSALAQRLGKREITDTEMIKWANDMASRGGKSSTIRSFKDKSIGTGVFLLDVLSGMKSSYVDYDLVTSGRTDEEAYANAKLSISIARKMGATIWLVPEDICQVRSRLVTTFIGKFIFIIRKDWLLTVDRLSHGYSREDVRNPVHDAQCLWYCILLFVFLSICKSCLCRRIKGWDQLNIYRYLNLNLSRVF
jgi:plastin-1